MVFEELIPRVRESRVGQFFGPGIDFIRSNPIVSTASLGIGVAGLVATAAVIRKKRKKAKPAVKRKKRSITRRGRKKTKAEIKAARIRNLAKARRARKSGRGKRKIIRGPGLGTREIKHSGRGTKGKFKLVSFRNKKTGKMVRFKVRK
ncbi:MAG TPA: hypothetical protein ENI23_08820 [bacterium]|nr:hypothetical protein [bacterium]